MSHEADTDQRTWRRGARVRDEIGAGWETEPSMFGREAHRSRLLAPYLAPATFRCAPFATTPDLEGDRKVGASHRAERGVLGTIGSLSKKKLRPPR
jgi:hypothetical protein